MMRAGSRSTMDSYTRLTQKSALQSMVVMGLLFVCGYVYAQLQERVGIVESTVNVFPGSISSNGWQNTETLLIQNVTGDALYQDFNTLNSAYLPENVRGDVFRNVRMSEGSPTPEPETDAV